MLRILFLVFLASESVRAKIHDDFITEYYPKSNPNPYLAVRVRITGNERKSYLHILQDITPDVGLKLSVQWVNGSGSECSNVILREPDYQDLCTALDKIADTNPEPPRPDEVLSLENQRCPLKKGSIEMPWHVLSAEADSGMPCAAVYYLVRIESEDSTPEKPNPYVTVYASFYPC